MHRLRVHSFLILIVFSAIGIISVQSTNEGWPTSTSGLIQTDWTGTWHGIVETFPEGQFGDGWHKTIIIGSYPTSNGACTVWNSTFTDRGVVKLTKDYRFCRGDNATDLHLHDGSGPILDVHWMKNVLISPFKVSGMFTVSSLRMRGHSLVEEILMAEDKLGVEGSLTGMRPLSMHFIEMERISDQE